MSTESGRTSTPRRSFKHRADALSLVGGGFLVVLGWLAVTEQLGNAFDNLSPWIIGLAVVVAVLVAVPAFRPQQRRGD